MGKLVKVVGLGTIVVLAAGSGLWAHSGPFDGEHFKGRIAFSSDGNFNDEDDWGAFPAAAAILDAMGVTDKLVHVDYCNIMVDNDERFYREMVASVVGSAERYGMDRSVMFDCQKDLEGAIESIRRAIDASSAQDPLYYVLAGPMEAPYLGIMRSRPEKRKFVYCISHSRWNDGYTSSDRALHRHNKRDVIPTGINWIQCRDGNPNLAHPGGVGKRSTPEQWKLYHWLRDSTDERLRWIFSRLEVEGRADISDATMTYFLLTGDENANLDKLRSLLNEKKKPAIMQRRQSIRIEAENFRALEGCRVDSTDRKASHRLSVRLGGGESGSMRTVFDSIYTASGRYDIEVRYFDEAEGKFAVRLLVDGRQEGVAWQSEGAGGGWRSFTVADVVLECGDEIAVQVDKGSGRHGKIDYVQFSYRN